MVARILRAVGDVWLQLERMYLTNILRLGPQQELVALCPPILSGSEKSPARTFDLKEVFDGFMWGVPTCRRSIEKRWMRKFGAENWHNKLILPKKDLKPCNSCGHYHEKDRLCPNCYSRVKEETKAMQEKMINELGINPIDKEVAIVYEGEAQEHPDEFFEKKRIIEMKKPRPQWFSKNLLQKSGPAVEPSQTSAIKINHLG